MNEQVFISYSRKDTDWADRIKASLESNGIACWMDREGINAGEKYTRKIINAIKQCDIFLLVLSENSEASEWVPKELGKAIQYHKYIIPVKISDFEIEEFELQLENIQIFELENISEIQSQITLINTIKQVLQLKPADSPSRQDPSQGSEQMFSTNSSSHRSDQKIPENNSPQNSTRRLSQNQSSLESRKAPGNNRGLFLSPDIKKKAALGAAVIFLLAGAVMCFRLTKAPSGDSQTLPASSREASAGAAQEPGARTEPTQSAPAPVSANEVTELVSLHMMDSNNAQVQEDAVNSAGHTFDQAVWAVGSFSESYATYYLGGGYTRFMGTLSCPDELNNSETYDFIVYLDNDRTKPAAEFTMSRSTPPVALDIDLAGCDTITFLAAEESRLTGFLISDGLLYGSDEQIPAGDRTSAPEEPDPASPEGGTENGVPLTSLHMMDSRNGQIQEDVVNSAGQVFHEAVWAMGSFSENYATFYTGGGYSRFTGTISCPDELNNSESYQFIVYLDDNRKDPAAEFTMSRSTPPFLLDLDITGCHTITFLAAEENRLTGFVISEGAFYDSPDSPPASSLDRSLSAQDTQLTSHHLMASVNASVQEDAMNSAGQTFDEAIVAVGSFSENLATFYLGQNYTRFVGTVTCPDDVNNIETFDFMVFLDNDRENPETEFSMSRSSAPVLLDLDVTGRETITFLASEKNLLTGFLLSDARFYGPGQQAPLSPEPDRTVSAEDNRLTSHHLMASVNASIQEDAINSAGQTFDEALVAAGSFSENLATFYLGRNYTRFTGMVSCPEDVNNGESFEFMILLDDDRNNPAARFSLSRSTPPVPLDIDVTGRDSISFVAAEDNRLTGFLVSDGEFQ